LINVSQPNLVERNALRGASNPAALPVFGLDTFYEEPGRCQRSFDKISQRHRHTASGRLAALELLDDIEEVIVSLGAY